MQARINETDACLIHFQMASGPVILAVPVNILLTTEPNPHAMDEFNNNVTTKYKINRLGNPTRYLVCNFHHTQNRIVQSQKLLIKKTLVDAYMLNANVKHKPCTA